MIASTEAGETNQLVQRTKAAVDHSLPKLTTCSPVLVASSVENWGILRGTVLRKREDDPSLCSGDKEAATESETFFSGMACDDSLVEAFFAEKEEKFLLDSNVDEKEETFLPTRMRKKRS